MRRSASARVAGKSLNEAAVDALAQAAGVKGVPQTRRDLGDIAGTWKPDKAVDAVLADQARVDENLWKHRMAKFKTARGRRRRPIGRPCYSR